MKKVDILQKLIDKKNLTTREAEAFLEEVIAGTVLPSQIGAILTALRIKGETVDEILGFIKAMRKHMIRVGINNAIDVCGTGGDGSKSFNISTAVSFVVAGAGVPVAKHGNRAASSTCGSADVLEALGVNIMLSASQAKDVLDKTGMVFLFAPLFHPATKQVALVRKEIKIRTIFNFLGPFLSPASVSKQLIGVPNKEIAEKLIVVGQKLGYKHLVIASSTDGMDEISLFAKTNMFTLKNNIIKQFVLDPKKYFPKNVSKKAIEEGTLRENAGFINDIVNGVKSAKRDIVVLNSAVVLVVADKATSIEEGIKFAEQSIDSGAAKKVLESVIQETQKYA